jgi:hypothetical protein
VADLRAYDAFLAAKSQVGSRDGFRPLWMPDQLFDFQKALVDWTIWRGRSALLADCGLGKTPCQLVWAENVVRHTGRPVLILTPLAVSPQTVHEGEKFGVECFHSRDGRFPAGARVVVTNYEQLHHFSPGDFAGAVGDESGVLKNFDGVRRQAITEFFRTLPHRLLCTATAAPNDYVELGTHSEALGELGYMDMLSRFFKNDQNSLHPNRTWAGGKWRFRGHAERDFWRWVCSWARALRKPSDLGFPDGEFILPELILTEHVIEARTTAPGRLFNTLAFTREEQLEERRRTLPERCEQAAELLAAHPGPSIGWCHLNPEGDLITRLTPGAVQVSGSDPDEQKEEVFLAFTRGEVAKLVTKGAIAGWGLNWQHCAHMSFFPSHSFEQYYQCVRRCWRFGQRSPVRVDLVTSDGEAVVLGNLQRKAAQAEVLFSRLVQYMRDSLEIQQSNPYTRAPEIPQWL